MKLFLTLATTTFLIVFFPLSTYASGKPANVGKADFVDAWHGTGDDHQANNEPGDTASDRHNFDDAAAGGSDKSPPADE